MTWPSSDVNTTGMDAGTDTPPRAEFLSWAQKFNQLRNHVSAFMQGLLTSADAAAVRSTLDVPTRTGGGASGIWSIGIHGNAATATTAANATNADLLDGIDSTGFTRSSGTSFLGSNAQTSANAPGAFSGGLTLRNAGGGGGTGTFVDAALHNTLVANIGFLDTGDGGCEVSMSYTPPGDPNTDRRVFGGFRLRNDGICEAKGFLPNGGVGAVGTYAFLRRSSDAGGFSAGTTAAGSGLQYSNRTGDYSGSPSGTWVCCGFSLVWDRATVWMRIS